MATKKKKAGAKRRPCPSCGMAFQKGRIVLRLVGTTGSRQRVCQACAALAVPVLASDAQSLCENCGSNLARVCMGCVAAVAPGFINSIGYRKAARSKKGKTAEPPPWPYKGDDDSPTGRDWSNGDGP